MRLITFTILMLTNAFLNAQSLDNERIFYHYEKAVNQLHFPSDSNIIMSTAARQNDFVWDLSSKEKKSKIETVNYGISSLSPNGEEICTVSDQYYSSAEKKMYKGVLSFYSIKDDKTTSHYFDELNTQKMCYHPTDAKVIALIGMDENFNYRSFIMDRSTFTIKKVVFQGKGAIIPLYQKFTPDGKYLLIAYGSSGNYGGIAIYDMEAQKEIKRIKLNDQIKDFVFLDNGDFYARGNKSVIKYTSNFSTIESHGLYLAAIHPDGDYGLIFDMNKKAYFYTFATKKKKELGLSILEKQDFSDLAEFYGNAVFSPNGKSLAIVFHKWHSNKQVNSAEYPSFMVYDIVQD